MNHSRLLGVIGISTLVLTGACGGSSGEQEPARGGDHSASEPAAPAKPTGGLSLDSVRNDPCQMVTQAEAEAILGGTADAPSKGGAVGTLEASCYYSVETAKLKASEIPLAPSASVNLMFSPERAKGGMNGKKYMENARKGITAQPVTGVGDEAFCAQDDPAAPARMIFVRVGDVMLNVVSKDCPMATKFAQTALARL